MNSSSTAWYRILWMAAIVPLFALSLPTSADAQVVVTTHPVKAKLKLLFQETGSSGLTKIAKVGADEGDIFEICTGESPTRSQGIFLSFDCANPSQNRIVAAETDPVSVIAVLGDLSLDTGFAVETQAKTGGLASMVVPASIEISCAGFDLEASGVLSLKYKALGSDGPVCPDSATFSFGGRSLVFDEASVVDTGSKLSAGKRSATIEIPLEDPNS